MREEEVKKLTEEYEKRREFYHEGLISRAELNQIELPLADAIARLEGDKRWLNEQDIAINEASMVGEQLQSPSLAANGYSDTGSLIRFNGDRVWFIGDAPKIQNFFLRPSAVACPSVLMVKRPFMIDYSSIIEMRWMSRFIPTAKKAAP